jgi:hypothetical protein
MDNIGPIIGQPTYICIYIYVCILCGIAMEKSIVSIGNI